MRAGIEPGHAATHVNDFQLPPGQIGTIHVGNFQLAARGRFEIPGDIDDLVVVEVKSGHGIPRFWLRRFFLDGQRLAVLVELDDTIAFRVFDRIGEDGSALLTAAGLLQVGSKIMAIEDVVTQHQRAPITTDKIGADYESLRNAFRFSLHGITNRNPPLAAVAEQLLETRRIHGR